MRFLAVAILLLASAPMADAQVVKPVLTPPPCDGPHNCPNYKRGAALPLPRPSQAQHVACPAGTVYNPRRGTCKVLSAR